MPRKTRRGGVNSPKSVLDLDEFLEIHEIEARLELRRREVETLEAELAQLRREQLRQEQLRANERARGENLSTRKSRRKPSSKQK